MCSNKRRAGLLLLCTHIWSICRSYSLRRSGIWNVECHQQRTRNSATLWICFILFARPQYWPDYTITHRQLYAPEGIGNRGEIESSTFLRHSKSRHELPSNVTFSLIKPLITLDVWKVWVKWDHVHSLKHEGWDLYRRRKNYLPRWCR